MRFSEHFGIDLGQSQLDFVDIPLDRDLLVFVDPYAITTSGTPWSHDAHRRVSDFFQQVLTLLREDRRDEAEGLMDVLREDNRPHLGYSNRIRGSGLGPEGASDFLNSLTQTSAFESGEIETIEDGALFTDGIGRDTVSDMLINILHEPLAAYTQEQCSLLGIPCNYSDRLKAWQPNKGWVDIDAMLPSTHGRPILLVPRSIVRKDLTLKPDGLVSDFLSHVDIESPTATASLETLLQQVPPTRVQKNGRVRLDVQRTRDLLKGHGTHKSLAARIAQVDPDALPRYKHRRRSQSSPLTAGELGALHHDRADDWTIDKITREVLDASRNPSDIFRFAAQISGALLRLAYPLLQHPVAVESAVDTVAAMQLVDLTDRGLFSTARRLHRASGPRTVLVLTASAPIDQALMSIIDHRSLMRSNEVDGVFIVGSAVPSAVRAQRSKLRETGAFPIGVDDLSYLMESTMDPEEAVAALVTMT